jgi:decaprenylphospho-beta-D-ribofuranose 2-oxidase
MYPRLPEWLEIKRRVDPAGVFTSDQARRLGLT